jgi:hypothetical protein
LLIKIDLISPNASYVRTIIKAARSPGLPGLLCLRALEALGH